MTWRVEREQFREKSRSSGVPRDEGRDGSSSEDGEHVLDSVRVLWVLLQHVQETRVLSRVEDAIAGVMAKHAFVPEHSNGACWTGS